MDADSRIVIDTSVLISALVGAQGASRQVLRLCLLKQRIPLISNALFHEYEAVASREDIRARCPLNAGEIRALLNSLYSVSRWVPVYYLWRPNVPDEADNFLVELAIAGNAAAIVTHNISDLGRMELNFPELRILTPESYLRG